MAQSEPRRLGVSVELKPHAYDPATNPELFDGVVSRRVVAFLIDFLILSIPVVFVSMFIFVIGIVTFGLGFLFFIVAYCVAVLAVRKVWREIPGSDMSLVMKSAVAGVQMDVFRRKPPMDGR